VDLIMEKHKQTLRELAARSEQLVEFGALKNAARWYRGENMSALQDIAINQAKKVSPDAAIAARAAFVRDNRSTNRLVLGAGILPPVATTAIGVGATYHSAGLGKKNQPQEKVLAARSERLVEFKDPRLERAGVSGFNQPKRTPDHPTKSHVVVAKSGDQVKTIRFGQQGVSGSPRKKGESDSYRKRRESFKARHAKNIAKGKMSAAHWSNVVKW
jgi:hypothetical protein